MTIPKILYPYSLLMLLLFALLNIYADVQDAGMTKVLLNSMILISLVFIPFSTVLNLKFYFSRKVKILFLFILIYAIYSILRDLDKGQFFSLFGNPNYGPSFWAPFFILWGAQKKSLYWLNKLSLLSIQVGVLLLPLSLLLGLNSPHILFYPTFFLLLNYKYSTRKDKIWIIIGTVAGIFAFWNGDYRSGIVRILICIAVFIVVQLNLKKINKYIVILMLVIPSFALFYGIKTGKSIISEVLIFGREIIGAEDSVTTDTRTFLYVELLSDLSAKDDLVLGRGPLGTYYSEYFYNYDGDHHIRHEVEVAVLYYLLKGGIIYLILVLTIILFAIQNALKRAQNKYVISLALILSGFLLYGFIENIPSYSFYFASIWIIVGVCLSNKFKTLTDDEIQCLIQSRN